MMHTKILSSRSPRPNYAIRDIDPTLKIAYQFLYGFAHADGGLSILGEDEISEQLLKLLSLRSWYTTFEILLYTFEKN
jgi:hypothetical protein